MDATTNQANVIVKKRTFGGLPPGAGTREDVLMVFEELEETRNIISQLQALSTQLPETEKGKYSRLCDKFVLFFTSSFNGANY